MTMVTRRRKSTTPEVPTRPRIALVYDLLYPWSRGGAERRFYEIGRRLSGRFDVAYFSYGATPSGDPYHHVGGRLSPYAGNRRSLLQSFEFALRLIAPLRAFRPHVVDCSSVSYAAIPACAAVCRLANVPFVVTWHEFMGPQWPSYLSRPLADLAGRFEYAALGLPTANVAVSRFTAKRIPIRGRARVRVIPNGVDLQTIAATPASDSTSDVLFVGRLIEHKRVDRLLEATFHLGHLGRELQVTIVGSGPEEDSLRRLAALAPSTVSIAFAGSVDSEEEVYALMKSAKVFALPSRREGYGLVVAEAQACGAVPLVVRSSNSAAVDLVEDERAGLSCGSDASELASGIASLLDDDAKRLRLRSNALELSTRRDWSVAADATALLYQELLRATW